MVYRERQGPINGNTDGRDSRPEISISFEPNDIIMAVFGLVIDNGSSQRAIVSIGFNMASGRQYGPYGGISGSPFTYNGPVYGIVGGLSSGTLCAIGFWVDPPSPPPAPPARPPPPLSPPPLANRTLLNNGRSQSALFGTPRNIRFDDGPFFSGKSPRFFPQLGLVSLQSL